MPNVNREYKDRLFKLIFGNEAQKEWTLSLYNAVMNTEHNNLEDISFNTLEDVLYLSMRNDISFCVSSILSLYEHQSTFNPNMPLRELFYVSRVFEKILFNSDDHRRRIGLYSSILKAVPIPVFVCFYNGTEHDDRERWILSLSDAYLVNKDVEYRDTVNNILELFEGSYPLELKVLMLNINVRHNQKLLDKCRPLSEYSWLIDAIREEHKNVKDLEIAIGNVLDRVPKSFVIKPFLDKERSIVINSILTEYDEQLQLELQLEDGIETGSKQEWAKNVVNILRNFGESASMGQLTKSTQLRPELINELMNIIKKNPELDDKQIANNMNLVEYYPN